MDILFHPSNGVPFFVEIGYFDTALEMKEKIQKYKGIPVSKQTLIFNGNTLSDDLNVHYSEILDRSTINILLSPDEDAPPPPSSTVQAPPPSSTIHLLLKMSSSKQGKTLTLEADINETVQRLKEKIQEMEGVPASLIVVHVNGTELQDLKTVKECELSDNSEINVVVRSSSSRQTMRVFVSTKRGAEKVPVEVSPSDNVGGLREKIEKMKLDLPREGYFFIYKQNVMMDDRSFRWHHVCQGDTIDIFSGSVSGGS